jgi:hypothetical protein
MGALVISNKQQPASCISTLTELPQANILTQAQKPLIKKVLIVE